jgi:hypothetical protein
MMKKGVPMRSARAIGLCSVPLVPVLLGIALIGAPEDPGPGASRGPDGDPSLLVGIAAPEHFGVRDVSLSKPIPVVLANLGKEPIRLWRDWCSWGHENISFEIVDRAGARTVIRRAEGEWRKNYPDFWTLDPAEPLVVQVKLDDGSWDVPPGVRTAEKEQVVKLRVVYAVERDNAARDHRVWTGKALSAERTYTLRR